MKKFIQNKLKDQKGLTLIELLAVIVILAIIAAIAIPAIGNLIENSRVGAVKSDALNVISAANLYYTDNPDIETDSVTIATLADGYLDDAASFEADTDAAVTREGLLTGQGTVGNVTLDFKAADRALINTLPNNTDNSGSVGSGNNTITVTR